MMAAHHSFDADLTTFFPFDPYKLPKSCSYIEGIYREWTSVAIDDDEDDEDEEDEDEDEDEDVALAEYPSEQDPRGPSSLMDDDAVGLGKSFGGMSISPLRPRQINLA